MSQPLSIVRVFRSYARSAKRYWLVFGSAFIVYALASIGSGVAAPLVYRRIIDTISNTADRAMVTGDLWDAWWILVGVTAFYQLMYRLGDVALIYGESKTTQDLNNRAFRAFMRQKHDFFIDRFAGSLVAQARRYARSLEESVDIIIFNFWTPIVHLTAVIATLFFIEPQLAVAFIIWIPIYIVIAVWMTRKKLPYDKASADQDSAITARLSDAISNIFAVKTFAAEGREMMEFSQAAATDNRARLYAHYFNSALVAIQTIMFSLLEIAAMYIVIRLWLAGSVSTGTVVLVQLYVGSIFFEMFGLGRAFGRLMKNVADASEMVETIERADTEAIDAGTSEASQAGGAVSFDHVSFTYSKGSPVFDDFSLDIRAGEKVGLVGVSGSGKSTLTKLLLRFVSPEQGTVRIDGQDITSLSPQALRHLIAYVPQDTVLFHRTIAENIGYGRPDSPREAIEEAAKKAHAHDFIVRLPNGYETLVGERGVKLSGGERQRVAIARAILKDAPILVLDEATSALDTESEYHIQEALRGLMRGRTTIVIAHRLSTVREMDRIVVLEEGRLVEEGTHAALVAKGGIYAGFWDRQTSSFGDVIIGAGEDDEEGRPEERMTEESPEA